MEPKRIIFVSAVSKEFHGVPPEQQHLFHSYRDVLKQAFRILAPHYEVIVQEDLVQGFGDLLETLDNEVARSLLVVHLVGDLAGSMPEPSALRNLHSRHPDFLAAVPDLKDAIGAGAGVSYTQWELYLAFHHGKRRLVFEAQPQVPRSPLFAPATPEDEVSQNAHRRRIEGTGVHRGPFYDQGDVARKSLRSFLHFRVDPLIDPVEPSADEVAEAWAHQEEIVKQLASSIKKPDPRSVPVTDPANSAAFVAAVRAAAERWQVNLATIVDIAARYEEQVRAAALDQPTVQALYDEAFAQVALGDYTAARFSARRAADLALQLVQQEPENALAREDAENALLLLHEAAKAAHDIHAAISALEEASDLINKEADPLRWADAHEPLAEFLLDHALWDRADEIVSDLIDIREDHQGENHPALAKTLLLWSRLLHDQAKYPAMESVAARAERILASQTPCDHLSVAAAINQRAWALESQKLWEEAEPLMLRVVEISEACGTDADPNLAAALNNLALLFQATGRLEEAEPLLRQALAIEEQYCPPEHPDVASCLSNLAQLLKKTNRARESEPLMRRALSIHEQIYGPEHPRVANDLGNLAELLQATGRLEQAEALMRQALAIDEQSFRAEHPTVAIRLNNLAELLQNTGRLEEAEPLMRRALAIGEETYGPEHPTVALRLNNLATVLGKTNQETEAERLLRRALAIEEQTYGSEHPIVARSLNNLAVLLHQNRPMDAEPLMRRALAIDERRYGTEHPNIDIPLNNLAVLLQNTNRQVEAELLMRRALAICEMQNGTEDPQTATKLNTLVRCLQDQDKHQEALSLCRRALSIRERYLNAGDTEIASSLNNLALSLVCLGGDDNLKEAEQHLLRAAAVEEFPNPHYWLARLYQKRSWHGDMEREVAQWRRYLELGATSELRQAEATQRINELAG